MTEPSSLLARLSATLGILAAEPDEQNAYLMTIGAGASVDELALDFDDAYQVLRPHFTLLGISKSVVEKLARLDAMLDEMSGTLHAELWTSDGLQTANEWSTVRKLADEIGLELARRVQ